MGEEQTNIPAQGGKPEPSSFRLIATLGVAGLVSGFCLVGAYLYTLPLIQAAKARALEAAIYEVLPGCVRYDAFDLKSGALVKAEGPATELPRVFAGYDKEGARIGFAIQSGVPGFQDIVGGIFGYVPETKTIVGLKILESKETPGLGDKIFKDEAFKSNFVKLEVEPEIVLVKKGEKANPNEVDAITGATISSRAVVSLLNAGMKDWKKTLDKEKKK